MNFICVPSRRPENLRIVVLLLTPPVSTSFLLRFVLNPKESVSDDDTTKERLELFIVKRFLSDRFFLLNVRDTCRFPLFSILSFIMGTCVIITDNFLT